jgi:hypothetical protein
MAAVAAMLAMPVQAADTGKVTLACEGRTTIGDGPVSESVIVDYNAKKIFSEIGGPVYPDIKPSIPEKVFAAGEGARYLWRHKKH